MGPYMTNHYYERSSEMVWFCLIAGFNFCDEGHDLIETVCPGRGRVVRPIRTKGVDGALADVREFSFWPLPFGVPSSVSVGVFECWTPGNNSFSFVFWVWQSWKFHALQLQKTKTKCISHVLRSPPVCLVDVPARVSFWGVVLVVENWQIL